MQSNENHFSIKEYLDICVLKASCLKRFKFIGFGFIAFFIFANRSLDTPECSIILLGIGRL